MEYTTFILAVVWGCVLCLTGYLIGARVGEKQERSRLLPELKATQERERDLRTHMVDLHDQTWQDAKDYFQEETRRREGLLAATLEQENSVMQGKPTSDLLMAYGVTTVGQLPKSVRETYNIDEKYSRLDIETLVRQETEGV